MIAAAFDVCGELPSGTTVLEASAGTGKTYTIAALAARYVAEGRAQLSELMLVTFGKAATHELRERVRERFVCAVRALADPATARTGPDVLLAALADAEPAEVARRRARLLRAVAEFDAATIATTHQFCQEMLAGLGVAGDRDPDAVFVDDLDDLLTEVGDDLSVRKYAIAGAAAPEFDHKTALTLAREAIGDPQARLEPADAPDGSTARVRHRFATAVRAEVAKRKRHRRMFTYDDMLLDLRAALTDPARGPAACARLRERYSVVLIDEFQDTDPVQWDIVRTAFHGHTTLVLIGDPKQAIYAFRGADVVSYLAAADAAGTHATLGVNHRSDSPLLAGLAALFGGAALGDERIAVRPTVAAHTGSRLADAPVTTPVRIRVVGRSGMRLNKLGLPPVDPVRAVVAADAAADLTALLAAKATVGGQPLLPGHVAVLVRTNKQGAQMREALAAVGVPAVFGGSTSVFGTPSARDWLVLLQALEQPHRSQRVAAAALTSLVGWTVQELAAAGEPAREELGATLRQWAAVLTDRGVAALVEAVSATGLAQRLLAVAGGERRLTDLRHVGAALHAAAVEGQLGLAAQVQWVRRRIAEAGRDPSAERSRRLESDADAVQILTVHASKGLEFPVVYVPFCWDRFVPKPSLPCFHDGAGARVLDVGGESGPSFAANQKRHTAEESGEDLRLLYVALTRAACQVVTWWAPSANTMASSLHRLAIGRPQPGAVPAATYKVPADEVAFAALSSLASSSVSVEALVGGAVERWNPPAGEQRALSAAAFTRRVDATWRRTSYSRLTAAAHDAPTVASEPEDATVDDERMPPVVGAVDSSVPAIGSPMADLPAGAAFGVVVHAILETTNPAADDLLAELTARAREQVRGPDADSFAAALLPSLRTPLGPLAGGLSLAEIAPRDRLTELDFELPLAGGDTRSALAGGTVAAIGDLLERHLPPGDPLASYPDAVRALPPHHLRGYLTGSIDAVLRVSGPRYVIVDYKTNRLGGPGPLTARDYHPALLADAMMAAHYPLQALLYSAALHRYLRWRQPGYDPASHLGGALYLFLRGMCGPDTPIVDGAPCGVFGWQPAPQLIVELSGLLDGGTV